MKLKIPKENANDDTVIISKIYFDNGSPVKKGELLLEFETSKATIEYDAPITGIFCYENLQAGSQINVDTIFGEILEKNVFDKKSQRSKINPEKKVGANGSEEEFLYYSESAEKLKDKNLEVKSSNKWIASRDFLEPFEINEQKNDTNYKSTTRKNPLPQLKFLKKEIRSKKQLEIKALSSNSSYLNSTIGIEIELKQRRKSNDFFSDSILDLVIYETTFLLKDKFSDLNAFFYEEQYIASFEDVIPGFALDNRNNLTVASIPEFKTLNNLSEIMTNIIIKFDEKKLTSQDIKPTTFTVTDLSSSEVNFVLPLINGYQAFIIGICRSKKGYQILGTFDHRVTEGKRFSEFLEELSRRVKLFAVKNFEPISCYYCLKSLKEEKSIGNRGFIRIYDGEEENLICRNCFDGV